MADVKSKQEIDFILVDDRPVAFAEDAPRPEGEISVQDFLDAQGADRTLMILAALQASPRIRAWLKRRQIH